MGRFSCGRGAVEIKGKGEMHTFLLADAAAIPAGDSV